MTNRNDMLDISEEEKVHFYGGKGMSFIPFTFFLIVAVWISILGAPDIKGMWVGAVMGLMLAFLLAREKGQFSQSIIDGMASPLAIVPVAAWIFAGLFANVLKSTSLVNGIIWAAYSLGVSGRIYVIVAFLASALFATSTGTGFGTIIAGISVLYPAGVMLGANPVVLAGAIVGGGAFGDNLAPLSDTTICSAASQDTDIGGVVRSRFKYAIVAGVISILILGIFGGGGSVTQTFSNETIMEFMQPKGILMLIPAILVIVLAMRGWNLISAITVGTVIALIEAMALGLTTIDALFYIKDGAIGGILANGIGGMVEICILAMLIMSTVRIMVVGGGIEMLLNWARGAVKTVRAVEFSIAAIITGITAVMGINAPPILAVGSAYAKPLGDKFRIHPYRRANLLDAMACTLVYSLPWTPALLLAQSLIKSVAKDFGGDVIPVLTTVQIFPWITYCWVMFAVMLFAIYTGWGRTYIGANGEPVKTPPEKAVVQ